MELEIVLVKPLLDVVYTAKISKGERYWHRALNQLDVPFVQIHFV
ncbi:hypothetical protein [Spirosoma terrae]|nr:hypothetical protein [Spirosoma terrae]